VEALEARAGRVGPLAGVGFRTTTRFNNARATLLAAGTTYYLFLALLSIITLAYGLTALLGTEWLARSVTEAISVAFPGVAGESLDVEALKSTGQTTSLVSGVALLYSATGAVMAASRSLHIIYGAPKDPRPFVLARLRGAAWLLVLAPLVLVSYLGSSITSSFGTRILELVGIDWSGSRVLVGVGATAITLVLDFVVVRLMLAHLGGIHPGRVPLFWGAVVGAAATEALKLLMAALLGVVVAKPQYGALAAPIGIMFVLFLQSLALYGAASLTAAIAEGEDAWDDDAATTSAARTPATASPTVVEEA
jgi:uncharacterized BrkB/YihY/UPF0761 family membrane protein